jgi:hypothetical protein
MQVLVAILRKKYEKKTLAKSPFKTFNVVGNNREGEEEDASNDHTSILITDDQGNVKT